MTRVCVLPGDGIGPEVIGEAVRLIDELDLGITWIYGKVGLGAYEEHGDPLPPETRSLVASTDATLFGAVTTPPDIQGYRSPIVSLRREFDMFANLRPCVSMPKCGLRDNVDLVVVRENTEGMYSGVERIDEAGNVAIAERRITKFASERIVRFACELARSRNKVRKVTVVHKANVLRETCGLFRRTALEVCKRFDDILVQEMLVDTCAMELIRAPENFDVIVTTNLFGDILSDEASMLVGGLGIASSANIGESAALFEPVHGSAPDISGRNIANPMAAILSAALMLDHLGHADAGNRVRLAVMRSIRDGHTTHDLGGELSTIEAADAVISSALHG